jgi:hypothetical protein
LEDDWLDLQEERVRYFVVASTSPKPAISRDVKLTQFQALARALQDLKAAHGKNKKIT